VVIGDPPTPTPERLARGAQLYAQAKCFQCHGASGKGDGPSAGELRDDLKFPIRPTDFTRGQFKSGSDVADVYRTMTTGLDGTPMPSFADALSDDERWAISYHVLSFSAFTDPLTGEPLQLDRATRARLNSPDGNGHRSPRTALDPTAGEAAADRPRVRFYKGILGEGRR
jgi:cytochrome c oxidase cbb3-type subunit 2